MAEIAHFQENYCTASAVVGNGQQLSASIPVGGTTLVGITTSAGLTSTAIRFQVSNDGVTFVPLHDAAGTRVSVVCDANTRGIAINPDHFRAWQFVMIDLGTAEPSGANLTLVTKPLA